MYKITLYDNNCVPICSDTTMFFTDDLEEFERNWCHRAEKEQLKRYMRSKAGEIVTDSYSVNPKENIFQEDKEADIFFEKEIVIKGRLFTLLNAYCCPVEVYAEETTIVFRGVRFLDEDFLIGKYKMNGVCQKMFSDMEAFERVNIWGNPIINSKRQEKVTWKEKDGEREITIYSVDDFKDDYLETYCFVTVGIFSKEEILSGDIDLESDEILTRLFMDIPGEAG